MYTLHRNFFLSLFMYVSTIPLKHKQPTYSNRCNTWYIFGTRRTSSWQVTVHVPSTKPSQWPRSLPSPCSSVGRASARCLEDHGFKPHWGLGFFFPSLFMYVSTMPLKHKQTTYSNRYNTWYIFGTRRTSSWQVTVHVPSTKRSQWPRSLQSPCSSVGRASARCLEDHGFKPHWGLGFFFPSLFMYVSTMPLKHKQTTYSNRYNTWYIFGTRRTSSWQVTVHVPSTKRSQWPRSLQSPCSSVGRASARCLEGHGFKPHWGLGFFFSEFIYVCFNYSFKT